MGTLFHQQPRRTHHRDIDEAEKFLERVIKIGNKLGVPVRDVLTAFSILEHERTNELYHDNGDTFDEQLAGFGELMQELIRAVRKEEE